MPLVNVCRTQTQTILFSLACKDLHEKVNVSKSSQALILPSFLSSREKKRTHILCNPRFGGESGESSWCAVCRCMRPDGEVNDEKMFRVGAKKGKPGYCDKEQEKIPDTEFEYDEDADDEVKPNEAWGFCDKNCFKDNYNLKPKMLQQVTTWNRYSGLRLMQMCQA